MDGHARTAHRVCVEHHHGRSFREPRATRGAAVLRRERQSKWSGGRIEARRCQGAPGEHRLEKWPRRRRRTGGAQHRGGLGEHRVGRIRRRPDQHIEESRFVERTEQPGRQAALLRGRALGVGEVKFTGQVLPTARLVTYTVDLKRVILRKLRMGIADATMAVDGRCIYTATDLKVGLFTSTDSF
jgi:hypothetical protein